MKIILITKNHKKPINIGPRFLLLIAIVFLAICTYGGHKFVTSPNGMKLLGLTSFESLSANNDNLLSSEDYRNNLNAYIEQIGELHIRLEDLDKQTERIQDVMKRQIVGKHKVPKLEKDESEQSKGGPLINDELSQKDIGLVVAKLMDKVEARESLSNKIGKEKMHIVLTSPARGYIKRKLKQQKISYTHYYPVEKKNIPLLFSCLDFYLITSRDEGGPR